MESQRLTRIQTEAFFFISSFPYSFVLFFGRVYFSWLFARTVLIGDDDALVLVMPSSLFLGTAQGVGSNFVHQAHNRSTSWQTYGNSLWRESCLFNQAKWIRFFVHIRTRFLNLKKKVKALVLSCAYGTVILYAPRETKLTYLHSSITIFFGASNFYDELNYIIYSNVHLE